ncbi:MAG TPA: mechanosensitive ion channel domain-containing protein, partial [Bryobacteraceae bacterium]|nr:mechanosensitive ion channel domain-containing protein [Bryobacteraceae bacterium]
AQQPSDSQPKDIRDTPRGTLLGFLEASGGGDYRRAASFLNIRKDHRRSTSPEELAQELKRVLDRKLAQDLSKISSATEGDLTDGLEPNLELIGIVRQGDRNVDLLLERVRLPEVGEVWLVAASTVSLIPILHADIDTTWLESFLPHWLLHTTVFDTPLWQWLAILILTLVATAFGHVLARILIRSLNPLVRRTHSALDDRLIEALRRPLQLLFALAAFRAGLVWIAPSYLLRMYLGRLLTGIIYLSIAWVLVRLVDVITTKLVAAMSGRQKTTVASIMPLTRRTIKVFVVCIAILATISSWGYDTTALLAGLGVGGVAVALAAQKTLENLFGGLAITSDKPVLVGDFCKYGDKVGTVEDIGLRSTRIRSLDRTIVTVPNGEFSGMQIENFGKRDKMSFRPILQLRRDTAPQKLHSLLPRLRQLLLDNPHIERTPRVRLLAIGSQSLDIEIFSYVLTPDYDEFLLRQEEILLRLLDVFAAERVELAMPMQLNFDGRQREIPRPSPQQPEPSQEK